MGRGRKVTAVTSRKLPLKQFPHKPSGKIASYVVAKDCPAPGREEPPLPIALYSGKCIVECIGNSVRKAAKDEYWHTKKQRKEVFLSCAIDCQGHDHTGSGRSYK